jgi:Glycosyltransferase family 87/WD40-like Beta Propeller Repeat
VVHALHNHRVEDHPVVCWLERGVLLLALLYLGVHTMPRAWDKLNTDFPNYYLSARIAHEGSDTARLYEWVWAQREKDHRALDARLVGLIPITPFSTLVMWPLTGLAPLTAKHVWLLVNLALLVPLCWLLRSMTGLPYQRIALVFALSFPLHRNLLYGQFYLLLLVLIVAGCWAYLREYYVLAGVLVALAAAAKIFPVMFFIFFLQRRAWRALVAGAVTGLASLVVSVAVFGWNLHRTYLHELLPWTLRGEALPPYVAASASISSVLHYLFLAEPQWNPQPWHSSPLCYALLQPTLQMLALAPAILLIRRQDRTQGRILLEWSALLVASVAISTLPASYHFVLLALPVCVLAALLLQREWYGWLSVLLIVYLGIGFPLSSPTAMIGPKILLYIPRLPLTLALLLGIYLLLWRDQRAEDSSWEWTHYAWTAAMAAALIFSVHSSLHVERAVRQEYAYRLPLRTQALLTANPGSQGTEVRYVAFTQSGYHLVWQDQDALSLGHSADDDLSFAGNSADIWVERGLSPHSAIVNLREPGRAVVDDAREPMLSADGQSLAFVRDHAGRGQLMVRRGFRSEAAVEVPLTPISRNVYEASFLSEKEFAFSAVEDGRPPQIYLTDEMHANAPLPLGESRYPAMSPDGRWMAYSHLEAGVWNLWVRDQRTGSTRRLADVPCNQIQPSWEDGSKTLLYGTDCGRSLWLTAVARRPVVP